MPTNPYPTLSELGFIHDPKQKIEWIFADYIAAKHSQSTIHFGKISSLSFDEFDGNYEGHRTAEVMQNSLTRLFSAYFETTSIQVTDDSVDNSNETRVVVKGVFTQEGKSFQLNEVLSVDNGRINKLTNFN